MQGPLADLGLTNPVLAAPMAGGPSTPALVAAAGAAGSLGFVAGGYKTPEALAEEIRTVRSDTARFGVNLFAPNPVPVDRDAFGAYARLIQPEGDLYGLDLAGSEPVEDDDRWSDKVDLLLADPVPLAGFTFGIPDRAVIAALHRAGTLVVQTVTSLDEARRATDAAVDVLVVQGSQAGGHAGTLTPERPPSPVPLPVLVGQIRDGVTRPLIAAGGLATATDVAAILRAGADATMVGTVLLRCHESGASPAYKGALADGQRGDTVVTRAFTGRPARALTNRFTERYSAAAPSGYPALHHLTSPLRRAAASAGDTGCINVWAGAGHAHATEDSAANVLTALAAEVG